MEIYQRSVIDDLPGLIRSALLATVIPAADVLSGPAIRVHLIRATKVKNVTDSSRGSTVSLGSVQTLSAVNPCELMCAHIHGSCCS